jgi:radical SAM superfamily enzyme YgiQ (UPF0313 family)
LVAASSVAVENFDVKIVDQRTDPNWRIHLADAAKTAYLVGVTAMQGPQILHSLEMLKVAKNSNPNVLTVWGGCHASLAPEITLTHRLVDVVVIGDGYHTLNELASSRVKSKPRLKNIHGIAFKHRGAIRFTPPRPLTDLNNLPQIPYEMVDVAKHLPVLYGCRMMSVFTSVGCVYNCRFCHNCLYSVNGHMKWRAFTAPRVINDLNRLHADHPEIEGFWFVDDEFFLDLKRAEEIIRFVKQQGLNFAVQGTAINTVARMSDQYLKMLEESGCKQLNMAVEFASPRLLNLINKKLTAEQALALNRRLSRYNIRTWYYFMSAFPTQTVEEEVETVKLAMKLLKENPNARISPFAAFTPYFGTEAFNLSVKHGYRPPKTLEECAQLATDNVNTPWVTDEYYNFVRSIQFLSLFIDEKAEDVIGNPILLMLAKLYRRIARHRMSKLDFRMFIERRIGFKLRDLMANVA